MKKLVATWVTENVAATSMEYALIAAGIAVSIVVVVQGLGTSVNDLYASVLTAFK